MAKPRETLITQKLRFDPKDTRLRPQDTAVPVFEAGDEAGDGKAREKIYNRDGLKKAFGELTDEQLLLAQKDGGFLAFLPGKKAVAFQLEPVQNRGVITSWRVMEIIGDDTGFDICVDDTFKSDLSNLPIAMKQGLDLYVRVAQNQASRLTRDMRDRKETSRTKPVEYKKTAGFAVKVEGGEVKLAFGLNKSGYDIVRIVGVSGRTSYNKGATYLLTTVPQELQRAVQQELAKTKMSNAA